jgi:hypothetical protein
MAHKQRLQQYRESSQWGLYGGSWRRMVVADDRQSTTARPMGIKLVERTSQSHLTNREKKEMPDGLR